jgi:hypothetical protein
MKVGAVLGAILAAAVVAGVASAGGVTLTSGPTLSDCGGQAVEPALFTLACGDGNYALAGMTWQHWGSATTTGSGVGRANDCTPNCAAGKFQTFPVEATASTIRTCRSGRKQYTKLVLRYPGSRPKGIGVTDTWTYPCDAAGPGSVITATVKPKDHLLVTGVGWQRGAGCSPTVSLAFADKAKPFASPKVGTTYGFQMTLLDIRAGSVIVARQECTTPVGTRLYESAIVAK